MLHDRQSWRGDQHGHRDHRRGHAGLSVAYYLVRAGLRPGEDFVILDRGPTAGGAWQSRWWALRLDDAHRVHDLPGMHRLGLSFATADASRPAREVVSEYYAAYEDFYGLDVRRPATVDRVEYRPAGFAVHQTDSVVIDADLIVNASGSWQSPYIPDIPGRASFVGRQLHVQQFRTRAEFRDQRVAVVGGGTSAISMLVELHGVAASTTWFTRRPVVFRPGDVGHTPELGAAAVEQQNQAARAGLVLPSIVSSTGLSVTPYMRALYDAGLLVAQPMFDRIEPDGVRLVDGTGMSLDAIVWATGFRAELGHLAPLDITEPGGGLQVEDGRLVRDRRIFLAGYGPQASTIGANRAGRATARQLLAELGYPPR
ncbi:MAG: pyridine nucleotide-disulfide oxidoreductase family protein [Frankiales bacterium]|nr:pyridine nucleotide-disulfide oxidoreductase family protein [Frankiales bacterium]